MEIALQPALSSINTKPNQQGRLHLANSSVRSEEPSDTDPMPLASPVPTAMMGASPSDTYDFYNRRDIIRLLIHLIVGLLMNSAQLK